LLNECVARTRKESCKGAARWQKEREEEFSRSIGKSSLSHAEREKEHDRALRKKLRKKRRARQTQERKERRGKELRRKKEGRTRSRWWKEGGCAGYDRSISRSSGIAVFARSVLFDSPFSFFAQLKLEREERKGKHASEKRKPTQDKLTSFRVPFVLLSPSLVLQEGRRERKSLVPSMTFARTAVFSFLFFVPLFRSMLLAFPRLF